MRGARSSTAQRSAATRSAAQTRAHALHAHTAQPLSTRAPLPLCVGRFRSSVSAGSPTGFLCCVGRSAAVLVALLAASCCVSLLTSTVGTCWTRGAWCASPRPSPSRSCGRRRRPPVYVFVDLGENGFLLRQPRGGVLSGAIGPMVQSLCDVIESFFPVLKGETLVLELLGNFTTTRRRTSSYWILPVLEDMPEYYPLVPLAKVFVLEKLGPWRASARSQRTVPGVHATARRTPKQSLSLVSPVGTSISSSSSTLTLHSVNGIIPLFLSHVRVADQDESLHNETHNASQFSSYRRAAPAVARQVRNRPSPHGTSTLLRNSVGLVTCPPFELDDSRDSPGQGRHSGSTPSQIEDVIEHPVAPGSCIEENVRHFVELLCRPRCC